MVRGLIGLITVLLLATVAVLGKLWYDSRLPSSYSAMEFGRIDYGGGPREDHAAHGHIGVETLRGPKGRPDIRFRLIAKQAKVKLRSGETVDAWTFDGQVPGPELRVRTRQLVEVTLVNEDIEDGVTIHWHGVDVPNAEDGVAGVTQDAVMPGRQHVYRFRAKQVGTFWYHSHQLSSKQVRRGLYGAVVIAPRPPREGLDVTAIAHDFGGRTALGSDTRVRRADVVPGTPVRVRLVNTNSSPERFLLTGTPFRVVAIDGTEVNRPTPIEGQSLNLGGGARFDVAFTMPERSVRLGVEGSSVALVFGKPGEEEPPPRSVGEDFDPAGYGSPAATGLTGAAEFDREFVLDLGKKVGFIDGRPGYHWAVNGKLFPETPMYMVRRGDVVKMQIENNTDTVHPMHLHGHHVLVLSRNGEEATGSPWWVDTLNVLPGEKYEVVFRADNPGIWMDHCHNLPHARDGMTMHLAYEGVTTRFRLGDEPDNHPE